MTADSTAATYRWLAGLMVVLAISGWGLFFVDSTAAVARMDAYRIELAQLKHDRDKLQAELQARRAAADELAALQAKLSASREDLTRTTQAAADAKAKLATAQSALSSSQGELVALDQKLTQAREQDQTADQTASVEPKKAEPRKRRWGRRRKR